MWSGVVIGVDADELTAQLVRGCKDSTGAGSCKERSPGQRTINSADYFTYRAASLAAVTCRVRVPTMGGFSFAHLA